MLDFRDGDIDPIETRDVAGIGGRCRCRAGLACCYRPGPHPDMVSANADIWGSFHDERITVVCCSRHGDCGLDGCRAGSG
jgi:hypothetical protein